MITKYLAILLIISTIFTACSKKDDNKGVKENRTKQAEIQQTTKDKDNKKESSNVIFLKRVNGEQIKLSALENGINFENYPNKVVILDFFATWCPPCRAEIPHLIDIQKAYKGKVQVIGVLMEENKDNDELQDFMDEFNINYPVTNSKENFYLSQALGGIRSLPTIVMYDTKGEYFIHYVGAAPQEMIEKDINKALGK